MNKWKWIKAVVFLAIVAVAATVAANVGTDYLTGPIPANPSGTWVAALFTTVLVSALGLYFLLKLLRLLF